MLTVDEDPGQLGARLCDSTSMEEPGARKPDPKRRFVCSECVQKGMGGHYGCLSEAALVARSDSYNVNGGQLINTEHENRNVASFTVVDSSHNFMF